MTDTPPKKLEEDKENISVPSKTPCKPIKHYFPDESGVVYDFDGKIITMFLCDLEFSKDLDKDSKGSHI